MTRRPSTSTSRRVAGRRVRPLASRPWPIAVLAAPLAAPASARYAAAAAASGWVSNSTPVFVVREGPSLASGTEPRRPHTRSANRPEIRSRIGIPTVAARLACTDPQLSWMQSWIGSSKTRRPRCSPSSHLRLVSAGFAGPRARHKYSSSAAERRFRTSTAVGRRLRAGADPRRSREEPPRARSRQAGSRAGQSVRLPRPRPAPTRSSVPAGRRAWARAPDRRCRRQLHGRAPVRRLRARRTQPHLAPRPRRRAVRNRTKAAPPDASDRIPVHRPVAGQASPLDRDAGREPEVLGAADG